MLHKGAEQKDADDRREESDFMKCHSHPATVLMWLHKGRTKWGDFTEEKKERRSAARGALEKVSKNRDGRFDGFRVSGKTTGLGEPETFGSAKKIDEKSLTAAQTQVVCQPCAKRGTLERAAGSSTFGDFKLTQFCPDFE
jgi:hypothetical protein